MPDGRTLRTSSWVSIPPVGLLGEAAKMTVAPAATAAAMPSKCSAKAGAGPRSTLIIRVCASLPCTAARKHGRGAAAATPAPSPHQKRIHAKGRWEVYKGGGLKEAEDEVEELVAPSAAADEVFGHTQEPRERTPEVGLRWVGVNVEDFARRDGIHNLRGGTSTTVHIPSLRGSTHLFNGTIQILIGVELD